MTKQLAELLSRARRLIDASRRAHRFLCSCNGEDCERCRVASAIARSTVYLDDAMRKIEGKEASTLSSSTPIGRTIDYLARAYYVQTHADPYRHDKDDIARVERIIGDVTGFRPVQGCDTCEGERMIPTGATYAIGNLPVFKPCPSCLGVGYFTAETISHCAAPACDERENLVEVPGVGFVCEDRDCVRWAADQAEAMAKEEASL